MAEVLIELVDGAKAEALPMSAVSANTVFMFVVVLVKVFWSYSLLFYENRLVAFHEHFRV